MRRFQVVIGGAVCLGWYMTVVYESLVHGRTCHLLYNNMPGSLKALMLENGSLASGGLITYKMSGLAAMALSHLTDIIAHPFLTYFAWRNFKSRGGSFRDLARWEVVACAYVFRVVYSVSHQYYNWGFVESPYYYGHEVYHIDDVGSYTVAYIGEAIWLGSLLLFNLYNWVMQRNNLGVNVHLGKDLFEKPTPPAARQPALRMSSSCFSESSSTSTASEVTSR